jgi:hypothetical protein
VSINFPQNLATERAKPLLHMRIHPKKNLWFNGLIPRTPRYGEERLSSRSRGTSCPEKSLDPLWSLYNLRTELALTHSYLYTRGTESMRV